MVSHGWSIHPVGHLRKTLLRSWGGRLELRCNTLRFVVWKSAIWWWVNSQSLQEDQRCSFRPAFWTALWLLPWALARRACISASSNRRQTLLFPERQRQYLQGAGFCKRSLSHLSSCSDGEKFWSSTILMVCLAGGIYNLPSHLSPGARDLIPRMLLVDPLKRITIPEIRHATPFQVAVCFADLWRE